MSVSNKTEDFFDFLIEEYADFFGEMEQFEQQKLTTMLSGSLTEIEHLLTLSQANAKKLDNLEKKRQQLQQAAGLGSLSMRELAAQTPGERGQQLDRQLSALTRSMENIRFYNGKSMALAEDNLRRYSRNQRVEQSVPTPRTLLETKA